MRNTAIVAGLVLLPLLLILGGWTLAHDSPYPVGSSQEEIALHARKHSAMVFSVVAAAVVASFVSGLVYLSVMADRRRAEESFQETLRKDPLTGLANRQTYRERLEEAVKNADRLGRTIALMFVDLDSLKTVNETYGHPVGDGLLKDVAAQLGKAVRQTDTVARLGGDEFAVILTNMEDIQPADMMAKRIIELVSQPRVIDDCYLTPGCSVGICFCPQDAQDPDELIRKAELALYQAKAEGPDNYHLYDEALHSKVKAQVALEQEMRLALARDEFVLHYQPQIDVAGGQVVGAEALVRWQHPIRGLVPPGEWIPTAEANGLIVPIGEWVLSQACTQNKAWQSAGMSPFRIAVNISACQFRSDDLVATVESVVRDTALAPKWLELEITESMVIDDVEGVIGKLERLNALGVEIAIDDFGTGYSSLAYLKRFPVDRLKVDRSFVQNITTDSDDAAITEAVINLGHSLNLNVIAEGVETGEQLAFLSSRGCDGVQGFYFGRPMPAEDFEEWISMRQDKARAAATA